MTGNYHILGYLSGLILLFRSVLFSWPCFATAKVESWKSYSELPLCDAAVARGQKKWSAILGGVSRWRKGKHTCGKMAMATILSCFFSCLRQLTVRMELAAVLARFGACPWFSQTTKTKQVTILSLGSGERDRETKAGSLEIPKCKRRLLVHGVAVCVINRGVEDVSARSLCLTGERDEGITCLDSWNHYSESGNTVWAKQDLSQGHLDLKR